MKPLLYSYCYLLIFLCLTHFSLSLTTTTSFSSSNRNKISIGFVYCDADELSKAQEIVTQLNADVAAAVSMSNSAAPRQPHHSGRLKVELKSLRMTRNENPISLSLSVCENLMSNDSVHLVIIGRTNCLKKSAGEAIAFGAAQPPENDYILTLSAISFTCAYYQIPVLDMYSRESEFSDKVLRIFFHFLNALSLSFAFNLKANRLHKFKENRYKKISRKV